MKAVYAVDIHIVHIVAGLDLDIKNTGKAHRRRKQLIEAVVTNQASGELGNQVRQSSTTVIKYCNS